MASQSPRDFASLPARRRRGRSRQNSFPGGQSRLAESSMPAIRIKPINVQRKSWNTGARYGMEGADGEKRISIALLYHTQSYIGTVNRIVKRPLNKRALNWPSEN